MKTVQIKSMKIIRGKY